RVISGNVEFHSKPAGATTNPFANHRRVLADATCEDDRVEAADRGSQGAKLTPNAIDEEIDCQLGTWLRALQQGAHVARNSRNPEQPRLLVNEPLNGVWIQLKLIEKVENPARIDRAATCTHG